MLSLPAFLIILFFSRGTRVAYVVAPREAHLFPKSNLRTRKKRICATHRPNRNFAAWEPPKMLSIARAAIGYYFC